MTAHGVTLLDDVAPPVRLLRLWDCGVAWKDVNPAKGVFVWDRLDAMVARGRCLLVLGATPQWAARDPQAAAAPWLGPGSSSPPRLLTDWDAYVRAVARRYGDRIDYQIWNEPQSSAFWNPISQIARLGVMTARAQTIIRRYAPHAKVVAAPVLPRPSSGGLRRGARVLKSLRDAGWPVDVYSFHAYPEEGQGPDRYRWMVDETTTALKALGAPAKPVWCTEVNYNLLHGPIAPSLITPYMQSTDRISTNRKVPRVYWYCYPGHSDPRVLGIPFTDTSLGTQVLKTL